MPGSGLLGMPGSGLLLAAIATAIRRAPPNPVRQSAVSEIDELAIPGP